MDGSHPKVKGQMGFFYEENVKSEGEDDIKVSPPSSPEVDIPEAEAEMIKKYLHTKESGPSPASSRRSSLTPGASGRRSSLTPYDPSRRRLSRLDIPTLKARAAHAKGLDGFETFGPISLDLVHNCGQIPLCCQVNHDGTNAAVGFSDGNVKIFNIATPDVLHLHTLSDDISNLPAQGATCVRYLTSPAAPNIVVSGYTSGHVIVWHAPSNRALATFDEGRETLSIAVDPQVSGSRLMSVGGSPQIFLYDLVTKKKVSTFEPSPELDVMDGHRSKVFACRFHPIDDHVFFTGGWDNTVQFWDTRSQRAVRHIFGPHICGDAIDLDVEHNHLVTGSWRTDEVVQIWDYNSGKLIKSVELPHKSRTQAYCTSWLGKQFILVAGSSDNLLAVIDRSSLAVAAQIRDLPGGVYSTSLIPNGHDLKILAISDNFLIGPTVTF